MSEHDSGTAYAWLGGAEVLRELVRRFYVHMDTQPGVREIRRLHGENLAGAEEKLFMFLSGWLGGPNLYWEAYGHPRLRMRHLPFPIGPAEREQWLHCMRLALDETVADAVLRERLFEALAKTADHMINR